MKKRRIVIASILKPVTDTRLLEKWAPSLASLDMDVHIAGAFATDCPTLENIHFHPLKPFSRTSWRRLAAILSIARIIHQVKPEHLIVNTPELLPLAIADRIFFGRKIHYDVLENYAWNVRYTPVYPRLIRYPLALLVRLIERLSAPFLSSCFLAERAYRQELPFLKPAVNLPNKLPLSVAQRFPRQGSHQKKFLFTGTLADSTGVFAAIDLVQELHAIDPEVSLSIVGSTAVPATWKRIQDAIQNLPYITVIGGDHLVEHEVILQAIQQADYGLIIYPPNPSTAGSLPTKLYEYLALNLPIVIRHTAAAHDLVRHHHAGWILSDYPDTASLWRAITTQPVQPTQDPTLFWESDAASLRDMFQ